MAEVARELRLTGESQTPPGQIEPGRVETGGAEPGGGGLSQERKAGKKAGEPHFLLNRGLENLPTEQMVRQEVMLINEVSLVLAEKRTSLSVMRTGLSVLVLPVSVLSVLVVISRYYDPAKVIYLLAPLLSVCALLGLFGFYLIYRSFKRIRLLDMVVADLKRQNPHLSDLCHLTDAPNHNRRSTDLPASLALEE